MMINLPARTLLAVSITVALSNTTHAAGFALIENAASGMGNAFAGAAAVAEDASTTWFNPAGMAELGDGIQVSSAGHIIIPKAKFTNKGSWVNPALTGGDFDQAKATLIGKNDDGGKTAFVPNAYTVKRLNDKFTAGVGINAPFGLETNYDDDWIGRYNALDSAMQTVNINPSIAYEVNEQLTFGGGVSLQYITVELGSAIDSAAACRSIASAANSGDLLLNCLRAMPTLSNKATDSKVIISGDDVSFGYNLGAMYKPNAKTKVGVSYRSAVNHELEGKADYSVNAALQPILTATGVTRFNDADVKAEANLPDMLSLSVAHNVNDKVELLGDITQTGWSSFERLRVVDKNTGAIVTNADEKWEDVTRYSVGANYQYNDRLKLRGGVALDKTPIPNAKLRTPRAPDTDRTWLAVGANYKLNKNSSLDLGYAHLFMDQTPIDNTSEDNGYALRGVYDASVDIISAQFNMSF